MERGKPHLDIAAGYPHIWWIRLLIVRGLIHGHRNCCWHFNTELHVSSWGQIMQLTHTLICEALQAGKCWDEIKGNLRWKLCKPNVHTYTLPFMEIQWKDNETLVAYVHCFKTAAKQCAFDNDIVSIRNFAKWLWDTHITAAKIYEKDPQALSEVIRIIEKFSVAQLKAMLKAAMVSMISNDDKCFVCGCMGHFGHHHPDTQCDSCDEFGHFTQDCPNKIPLSRTPCQHDSSHLRQWYTYTQRDRSHSSHYGHRQGRHFNWSWSHHHSHCDRSRNSFRRHTLYSSSRYYSGSCHPSTNGWPITTCAMTHPTGIVAPYPAFTISPTNITHTTIPQTGASITPATLTAMHGEHSWWGKWSIPKTFNPS